MGATTDGDQHSLHALSILTDSSPMVSCLLIGTHSRDRMSAAKRADLEPLLSLDTAEEDFYEQPATEFFGGGGDATRH
jgi:hypothetical protein